MRRITHFKIIITASFIEIFRTLMRKYLFILITLFVAGYLASKVQSSWGKVRVQSIKIPTQNGQWLVADLFKPVSANASNPSPLVIVVPGFQRSKETLSNISIEL